MDEGLIEKIANGKATDAELAAYNAWCRSFQEKGKAVPELAAIQAQMLARIHANIDPPKRIYPFYRVAAAAAILLFLWGGLYLLRPATQQLAQNDIAPGRNSATLTLANGQKILLNTAGQGLVAKEAGVAITKTADGQLAYQAGGNGNPGQFNTLSTANGEAYQVRLPDGTRVWLNAASSLTYPLSFASVRQVKLTGEGYFEVAKDKLHPFTVKTAQQDVTVLGTHFNINAYPDEAAVRTTLFEGSVRVDAGKETRTIKPGEQAVLTNTLEVKQADTESALAWKNGDFIFKDEGLQAAMLRVARWYNVDVVYAPGAPKGLELGGWVSRSKNISAVLHMMEATGKVHFKIEGRRVMVEK